MSSTVAIIGANGQVGAELCLLLAGRIRLVPICRTRSGSAFLRWHGIACRHGRVADPEDAPRLLADCDVVVNCSLAAGTPAQIRQTEDRIAHNACAHSMQDATVIHFSTQSVYGDPGGARWIRWRNPYGRAKLATEASVRRAGRKLAKRVYVLRLGHVCGSLQEISATIRAQLMARTAVLPDKDRSSNTVYTAALAGAVLQILEGNVEPGIYDLMNSPRWSWSEVYDHERAECGIEDYLPEHVDAGRPTTTTILKRSMARTVGTLASLQWTRDALARLFAHLPGGLNARAQAWWYSRRARSEISALCARRSVPEHLTWVENGSRFFPASKSTRELLAEFSLASATAIAPWPDDLPDAVPKPHVSRLG